MTICIELKINILILEPSKEIRKLIIEENKQHGSTCKQCPRAWGI